MALGRHSFFSLSFLFSFFLFFPFFFSVSKKKRKKKENMFLFHLRFGCLWGFRDSSLHALPVTSLWFPLASYSMFTCDLFCYPYVSGAFHTFTIFPKLWGKLLVWIYNDKGSLLSIILSRFHYSLRSWLLCYTKKLFLTSSQYDGVWEYEEDNSLWLYKQFILYA